MEAVGIALGAAPLAIQALDGVRKGFEIFEEAALADRQFQHFKICLHMEYARISEWSVMTGLLHAEGDKTQALRYDRQLKHNGSLVVAALTQIQMLLRDLRRTELTYDYLIEESPLASPTSDSHQPVPKKSRDIAQPDAGVVVGEILAGEDIVPDRRQNFIKRTWRAAKKPMKDHKRFWWAIRDTKKFEKSLVQIAELIDFLQEMLTKDQMTKVLESTNNLNLMMLQLANDITEVKAVLWAGDARRPATLASSGDGLDGQTLVGDVDDRASAHFWREAARFSIDIAEESATFASSRRLAQEDVEAIRYGVDFDGGARTMATMARGQDVWVEWRSFTVESAFNRAPRKEDIERVERLVSLLYISRKPVQFCVPRCLGYFQDGQSTRFGLVFEPPRDEGHSQPISLRACFEHRQANLKTKICLAQQLTQWLMYLHVVNWMHKGLRSAIVLFFLKGEVPEDLGKPFVTGFEYSRIANQDTTLGPTADDIQRAFYVHPDYLGYKRQLGFLKTYDIYSLGVILIEIAYWQPISDIYRLTKPTTQDDAEDELEPAISDIIKFRDQTLNGENGILHHISMVMGDSFHAATKACLQGMSGLGLHQQAEPAEGQVDEQADVRALEQAVEQGDVEVAADIQQGFIDQVIDVMKQISV